METTITMEQSNKNTGKIVKLLFPKTMHIGTAAVEYIRE